MTYGAIYPYTWWGNRQDLGFGTSYPFLLNRYGGAAAAYSLRSLSSDNLNVVRVRRDSDNAERDFKATEVTDGTLQNWVNGVLDDLPLDTATAAAAYSLRNLKSDYSGSVVRVRRSSDNAEADFTAAEVSDGTLEAWVGTSGTDNGFVTTWYDQAGSNNATQGTASSQPKIVDAGSLITENGKAAVSFDGVNDYIPISDFDYGLTDKLALSGVFQVNNNGAVKALISQYDFGLNQRSWVYGFSSSEAPFNNYSTNGTFTAATAQGNIFTPISTNQKVIFSQIDTSLSVNNRVKIWIDGTTNTLTSTTNDVTGNLHNSTGDLSIGSVLNNNVGADLFYGKIQEIILYPSDQSTNRTKIENNISTYYDIYDTSANGYVATWYDQSVNGNDATQATASAQPQIVSNGVIITDNGKPSLDFDGTNQLSFTIGSPNSLSAFLVSKWDDLTTGVLTKGNSRTTGSTRDFDIFGNGTTLNVYFEDTSNNVDVISLGVFDTSFDYLISAFHQSGNIPKAALNSSLINGTISLGNLDTDQSTFNIGGGSGSIYQFDGKIKEAILYPSDQTDNKADIENEINNYYTIYAGSPISGLLYDYPSSAAAYSVRQLTIYDNDYKETLVKVRRSSDNAEVDVKADTNYEISLNSFTSAQMSLGDWIGSDDGYVVTWYDQSGNDNDATQSTASSQPQLISGGAIITKGGKASVKFDGSDDYFNTSQTNPFTFTGGVSMIHASYKNATAYKGYETILSSGASGVSGTNLRQIMALGYSTSVSPQPSIATDIWQPSGIQYDGTIGTDERHLIGFYISNWSTHRSTGLSNLRLNGSDLSTKPYSTTDPSALLTNPIKIGVLDTILALSFFGGEIQEIIAYASDKNSDREAIETNINNYFNIYP